MIRLGLLSVLFSTSAAWAQDVEVRRVDPGPARLLLCTQGSCDLVSKHELRRDCLAKAKQEQRWLRIAGDERIPLCLSLTPRVVR